MQIISQIPPFFSQQIHFSLSAAQWPWISRPQRHCVLLGYPANKNAEAKESIRNSTNKQTFSHNTAEKFLGGLGIAPPLKFPKQDSTKLNDVDLMVIQHLNCFPFFPPFGVFVALCFFSFVLKLCFYHHSNLRAIPCPGPKCHQPLPLSREYTTFSSCWFHPISKICSSNWIMSPGFGMKIQKYLSCHHLPLVLELQGIFPTYFCFYKGSSSKNPDPSQSSRIDGRNIPSPGHRNIGDIPKS